VLSIREGNLNAKDTKEGRAKGAVEEVAPESFFSSSALSVSGFTVRAFAAPALLHRDVLRRDGHVAGETPDRPYVSIGAFEDEVDA
jgi:hypothetical protein